MLKSSYNPFAADVWSLAVTMINFATQVLFFSIVGLEPMVAVADSGVPQVYGQSL